MHLTWLRGTVKRKEPYRLVECCRRRLSWDLTKNKNGNTQGGELRKEEQEEVDLTKSDQRVSGNGTDQGQRIEDNNAKSNVWGWGGRGGIKERAIE